MFRYILDVLNLDGKTRARLRWLLGLVPLGAGLSLLLLYLLPDPEVALKILVAILGVCFLTVFACNIYGKLAGLITWPLAKFSNMPRKGQKLLLVCFGTLLLCAGMALGMLVYAVTGPRWVGPPEELLERFRPLEEGGKQ